MNPARRLRNRIDQPALAGFLVVGATDEEARR